MKKRLEADLISIAHRILQLKNRTDINQLYLETQKLYEKLAILRFVEEHFGEAKPTIGQAEIVEKLKQFFEDNTVSDFNRKKESDVLTDDPIKTTPVPAVSFEHDLNIESLSTPKELITEEVPEELATEDAVFTPSFDLVEEVETEIQTKPEVVQISFEDLLDGNFDDSMFVKVNQIENIPTAITTENTLITELDDVIQDSISSEINESKIIPNEKTTKGIAIDLNDRIGFVKHLFGNDTEDYNRVLSQLITFDDFEEAQSFIEEMVKPDYNNWEGKEDYVQRFIEVIERKFANQKETK